MQSCVPFPPSQQAFPDWTGSSHIPAVLCMLVSWVKLGRLSAGAVIGAISTRFAQSWSASKIGRKPGSVRLMGSQHKLLSEKSCLPEEDDKQHSTTDLCIIALLSHPAAGRTQSSTVTSYSTAEIGAALQKVLHTLPGGHFWALPGPATDFTSNLIIDGSGQDVCPCCKAHSRIVKRSAWHAQKIKKRISMQHMSCRIEPQHLAALCSKTCLLNLSIAG